MIPCALTLSSENETSGQAFHMPPPMPEKIGFWFLLLERQFKVANIIEDEEKATTLLGCLDRQYLLRLEDIVTNFPATGQYDILKDELIRIQAELNSERVTRLVENEVMGNRKPSQFYHDLENLASPFVPEKFILNLWKNQLPVYIQEILAMLGNISTDRLIRIADKLIEVCTRNSQRSSDVTVVSDSHVQNIDSTTAAINALHEKVRHLETKLDSLNIDNCRRTRSHSRERYRRR
jgi:ABC-type transporter Mla MlaB component